MLLVPSPPPFFFSMGDAKTVLLNRASVAEEEEEGFPLPRDRSAAHPDALSLQLGIGKLRNGFPL